ncbi:MAG: hypothetical protein UV38_C0001G0300 [candidate division TM6 bacterium GW2011_GWE2_42_60]|nr:MAG: hypothetical protein UV38_C0001G0300 [candidate division TM6 bacterium GW2011_GWE2_42_60]HBY05509.1 hypothetical protein [Candidatus Dependentiae bacterium]
MSLWLRKTSELEEYARRCALWGALVLYLLTVVLLFICFMPQRHTVALAMPRQVVPAPVMFHSWGKRGSCGMGHAHGLIGARHLLKRRKKQREKKAGFISAPKRIEKHAAKKAIEEKAVSKKGKPEVGEPKRAISEKREPKKVEAKGKEQQKSPIKEPKVGKQEMAQKEKPVPKKVAEVIPEKIPEKSAKKEVAPVVEPEQEREPALEEELATEQEADFNDDDEVEAAFGVSEDGEVFEEDGLSREGLAVMRSVGRAWRPPRGLSPLLSARLIVSLYNDGSIEKVVIEKKSGVLAFDMAARAALWRAEYPSVFWGKNIAVAFGKLAS